MICPYCGGYGETVRADDDGRTIVERCRQCRGGLYQPTRPNLLDAEERKARADKAWAKAIAILDDYYSKKGAIK